MDEPSTQPLIHPETRIGHVHLKVADIERALGFYRDLLGFEVTQWYGEDAVFLSAGGYHHHLGFNVWRGEGVPPVPEGRVGLRHWTVVLEDSRQVAAVAERVRAAGISTEEREGGGADGFLVRDPWGSRFSSPLPRAQRPRRSPILICAPDLRVPRL